MIIAIRNYLVTLVISVALVVNAILCLLHNLYIFIFYTRMFRQEFTDEFANSIIRGREAITMRIIEFHKLYWRTK